jgi:hypothetical protein
MDPDGLAHEELRQGGRNGYEPRRRRDAADRNPSAFSREINVVGFTPRISAAPSGP